MVKDEGSALLATEAPKKSTSRASKTTSLSLSIPIKPGLNSSSSKIKYSGTCYCMLLPAF